jgi:hypothetical protein
MSRLTADRKARSVKNGLIARFAIRRCPECEDANAAAFENFTVP